MNALNPPVIVALTVIATAGLVAVALAARRRRWSPRGPSRLLDPGRKGGRSLEDLARRVY